MTIVVAKFQDKVVQVVRYAETVAFSPDKGWFMVCSDWQQSDRMKQNFTWVPSSTRFDWVREFTQS